MGHPVHPGLPDAKIKRPSVSSLLLNWKLIKQILCLCEDQIHNNQSVCELETHRVEKRVISLLP